MGAIGLINHFLKKPTQLKTQRTRGNANKGIPPNKTWLRECRNTPLCISTWHAHMANENPSFCHVFQFYTYTSILLSSFIYRLSKAAFFDVCLLQRFADERLTIFLYMYITLCMAALYPQWVHSSSELLFIGLGKSQAQKTCENI